MNSAKKHILIIDDSPADIQVIIEIINSQYATLVATSGEKGIEIAKREQKPDIILMDVEMSGMNGYETCKDIKENEETSDIDVIFVSAHNDTGEILKGYEAGGIDYLIKPVQADELLQKIKLAINNKQLRADMMSDKEKAYSAALIAISNAGEQGIVLDFLRNCFAIKNAQDLAKQIVQSIERFSLDVSAELRMHGSVIHAGSKEPLTALEKDIFNRLHDQGRVIDSGRRIMVNFGGVSLLVKNMPADEERRGRLRDHIAILIEGAELKLGSIMTAQSTERRKQTLQEILKMSRATLQDVQQTQRMHKEANIQIMDNMMHGLETLFVSCGLTEQQESSLIKLVQDGLNRALSNFEDSLKVDEQVQKIIEDLAKFARL